MRRLILLLGVVAIACLASGCAQKEEIREPEVRTASQGPFELIVEAAPADSRTVTITPKLKYTGDQDIQILHGNPLISVVVVPRGGEVEHTFDSIARTSVLKANEATTFGGPKTFEAARGESVVSVLAGFEWSGKVWSIPLEFEY